MTYCCLPCGDYVTASALTINSVWTNPDSGWPVELSEAVWDVVVTVDCTHCDLYYHYVTVSVVSVDV